MTKFMIWDIDRTGPLCLRNGVILGHEDVSTSAAVAFGFIVEAGVGVSTECHVAAGICGAVVRVGGEVVEELVDGFSGGFSGSGLLGAQGAESDKLRVAKNGSGPNHLIVKYSYVSTIPM